MKLVPVIQNERRAFNLVVDALDGPVLVDASDTYANHHPEELINQDHWLAQITEPLRTNPGVAYLYMNPDQVMPVLGSLAMISSELADNLAAFEQFLAPYEAELCQVTPPKTKSARRLRDKLLHVPTSVSRDTADEPIRLDGLRAKQARATAMALCLKELAEQAANSGDTL